MSTSTVVTPAATTSRPKPHRPGNRAVLTARPAVLGNYGSRWDARVAWTSGN